MSKSLSRRIQVLSCLEYADTATFHALLPVLARKDLVRLVGLLQQSMLEEQRRFTELSQCLRASLDSRRNLPALPSSIEQDDTNTHSEMRPKSHLTNDDQSHSEHFSELIPLMESSMVSNHEKSPPSSSDASYYHADQEEYRKLSVQWDNGHLLEHSPTDASECAFLIRVPVEQDEVISDDVAVTSLEELENRLRAEQEHRDFLARELCLSQSRLAQLCAKNVKVFNQQQHRRRYGLDDYRSSTTQTSLDETSIASSSSSQQRKSLSTLHKERKLKELSSESPQPIANQAIPDQYHPTKSDLLRQHAFQSVLTDILSGHASQPPRASEISPESGYNSSSSLKSPSSQRILQQQIQSKPAKRNEFELRASRDRILEQVRSRRASAPPVQHLNWNQSIVSNRAQSQEQRPLKSILKKRQPEQQAFSRSVDLGTSYQHGPGFATVRSSSFSEDADTKRNSIMSASIEEKSSDIVEGLSISTSTSPAPAHQPSPVPKLAERPGPSEPMPDSPGPYLPHIDYPSPVRNGGSSHQSKRGDLPDVVVLKLGSKSPQTSVESDTTDPGAPRPTIRPAFTEAEKPKSLKELKPEHGRDESTESQAFREWDPKELLKELYTVRYDARPDEKRQRFVNMEGHLEHLPMNMRAVVASDTLWRTHYFRTKDGKLQWFDDAKTDSIPFGEMILAGAEVDLDKNACTCLVHNSKENQLLTIRYPPHLLDKWRTALLNHASSATSACFVRPIYPPIPHADEHVCVIEIGSCSIRAGSLTAEPSLPQTYFPSIACVLPDGTIVPGSDALSPSVRHDGTIIHPITPTLPAVNRYSMDLEIVKHLLRKVFEDLQIDSSSYQIMLSVPQNAPIAMVGDVMRSLLTDFGVRGVFVSRQPFLILYAYDVTTGVVVDFGDRLNIVPVIDGYVVQSAIVSLPYGGHNVCDGLKTKLIERNWTPYSFMSEVEKYILRYIMEKTCYLGADFDDEAQRYDQNPADIDMDVNIEQFGPTPEMPRRFHVDASRFTSPEGIFKPKRWGFDIDGLHKLIYHAIQGSPLDSRRVLYRNIYLAGGASLLPGLVERLESELTPLVASSVQIRVRTSPWRDHAAYIGAQIVAGGIQFEQQLIKDTVELDKFIRRLYSANF